MAGERNNRKPYNGDKTWTIEYSSVVGTQITQIEGSSTEIVYIRTTSVDWQIHQHFSDTLPKILTTIKMGNTGKLANIWAKPEQANSDIPSLLKKLNELKEAGIITEAEFQQKKQKLLNQI
ncbi:MAG: SHOCT domain-containing protein [Bacteroidetes bacterium]|nr:SHOCT domain-containing protein [Bacteroidota bacterium]